MLLSSAFHVKKFAPGVYDNSDFPLTDLERKILELRSKDRHEETVASTAALVDSPEVGSTAMSTHHADKKMLVRTYLFDRLGVRRVSTKPLGAGELQRAVCHPTAVEGKIKRQVSHPMYISDLDDLIVVPGNALFGVRLGPGGQDSAPRLLS